MLQNILQLAIFLSRASLAAVLVAAGAAKLVDPQSFAATVRGLGMPARRELLIRGLARIIPAVEVGLGLAIVTGLWPTIVNGIVLVLMCSFSLVVIVALRRRLQVVCRCFGILSDSQFSGKGLARSLFLTLLAVAVVWGGTTYRLQFSAPLAASLLLVAGFMLFGLAAAQAAKTLAELKERIA